MSKSPISGRSINAGLTGFVDDVGNLLAARNHQDLFELFSQADDRFDECLQDVGMTQNLNKQEFIFKLYGPGTVKNPQKLPRALQNRFRTSARYLGPCLHWNGRTSD